MAKISQYEVSKFSPQAVGVGAVDKSGVEVGRAVQNLGEALSQRQEKVDTLAATARFGDFELAYTTKKAELQQTYRDNPKAYPQALREEMEKISTEHAKSLQPGVAEKFGQLTTQAWVQDADNAANWAIAREQEIVIGDVHAVYQNAALMAERSQSPDDLQSVIDVMNAHSRQAQQFVSADTAMKWRNSYVGVAKESAMMGQILANPTKVYRDLQGGAYQGILEPAEIATYTSKARDAVFHRAEDDLYKNMFMAQGELLDVQQRLDAKEVTIGELIVKRQAAQANKDVKDANGNNVVSPEYIRGLDNLITQLTYTNQKFEVNKDTAKAALESFDRDWDAYLQEKKDTGGQPNTKDVIHQLKVYADLTDLYNRGVIDKPQFDAKVDVMRTKLSLRAGKSAVIKSFDQVLEEAGKGHFFRDRSDDVFVHGYREIKNYVDKAYGNLDATSKSDLKAQMLSQYTQRIKNAPEETLRALGTDAAKRVFAHNLVFGAATTDGKGMPGVVSRFTYHKDPSSGRTLFIGDVVTQNGIGKVFQGLNPETGKPFWGLSEASKGQVITNAKGQSATVIGMSADGQPILQRND